MKLTEPLLHFLVKYLGREHLSFLYIIYANVGVEVQSHSFLT